MFKIDIDWNMLIGKLIKITGYSMQELYSMTIDEFFITVENFKNETDG